MANFVGVETVLTGRTATLSNGTVRVAVSDKILEAVDRGGNGVETQVLVCIRPQDVTLSRALLDPSPSNQFPTRVVGVTSDGALFKVTLDAGFPLVAYVAKQSYFDLALALGVSVVASVQATAVHLIAR